jgi:hypothetical protein
MRPTHTKFLYSAHCHHPETAPFPSVRFGTVANTAIRGRPYKRIHIVRETAVSAIRAGNTGQNDVTRLLTGTVLTVLLSFQIQAADHITREHIQQVIDVTDAAAKNRDAAGIGEYLSETFEKIIEFSNDKWIAEVRVDKKKYLDLIEEGWPTLEEYDYQRDNTVIHVTPDGLSGQSYSTITETLSLDGTRMVSKFREHALYTLENGRPVITQISGHTLIGDTMPAPGQ